LVVTSVLKSNAFQLTVGRETAQNVMAGAAGGAVGKATVEARRSDATHEQIAFTGPEALSFAFGAARLLFEDGEYADYASAQGLTGFEAGTGVGSGIGELLLDADVLEPFDGPPGSGS
jgi:hypothetical protein